MGQPTYITKPLSSNPIKNNTGTVLHAGTVGSNVVDGMTLREVLSAEPFYGWKATAAVSPDSSGNLGTMRPLSSGKFAYQQAGKYVIRKITDTLAGVSKTHIQSGASDFGNRRPIHRFYGYQRLHITDISFYTGAATTGANAGVTVLASGVDGTTGQRADHAANPSDAVPGELVYMTTLTPTQDEYASKTNP